MFGRRPPALLGKVMMETSTFCPLSLVNEKLPFRKLERTVASQASGFSHERSFV
jgi:hypothetical protein